MTIKDLDDGPFNGLVGAQDSASSSEPACSAPTEAQIEKVARAISRAYIQGFRHAHHHLPPDKWITNLDEAVDLQWEMFCSEAVDALMPNSVIDRKPQPPSA